MKKTQAHNYAAAIAPIAGLLLSSLAAHPAPAMAQALPPVVTGNQVCQTFNSNATPYGYVGVANVDLGAVFSAIDTISGTISGSRTNAPNTTVTLPKAAPTGMWGNRGYLVPPWGSTGGWKSYMGYLGGGYPGQPLMLMDVIDVRFGTNDGIHPGKAQVPQGVQGLYVVQRNEHGHAPLKLAIKSFSLTICGQPKQVVQIPDCGNSATNVGQQCYGYLIHRTNYYTGKFQNSYSPSTLPSSYPGTPRCTTLAPATTPAGMNCMRKFIWNKVASPATSLYVTNPLGYPEVLPPN